MQLKSIFENSPDAIVVINDTGCITLWNPTAEKIFGWLESEAIDQPLQQLLSAESERIDIISLTTLMALDVQRKTIQLLVKRKNGLVLQTEASISRAGFNEGSQFILFFRDTTTWVAAEKQLKMRNATLEQRVVEATKQQTESEWKYRNLFENNPLPMWILEVPSLRFMDVNESAIRQYGYSKEEFLSMTAYDIRPEEDKIRYSQLNLTDFGTQNRGMWRHVKKDGTIIYAAIIVHEITYQEQPARLILSNDITEQKKAEDALKISERRFRRIFDSKLIGFVVWNSDHGILQANDVFLEMLGYTQHDLKEGAIDWHALTPPDYAALDDMIMKQLGLTSVCEPIEKEYTKKDGTRIPVLVGAANIGDNLIVSYIMDISQQKEMANEIVELNKNLEKRIEERTAELLAANKELESFSYTVSHDLRTPLRAIHGYSHILTEDFGEKLDTNGIRLLDNIKANAKKMGQLVDDLLTFFRIGKRSVARSTIRMNNIVETVLASAPEIDLNKVSIKVHELGVENADPTLIRIVFQNLINNAVKYSSRKEDPEIEIGIIDTNGLKTYFIKDNGDGFDMKYYNKLFGVFQRLHAETEIEGTGVGLAIVHRIISKHGGHVWAEGRVSAGAVFYFTLNDKTKIDERK